MLVAVALFIVNVRASTLHCIHLYQQFGPLAVLVRSRLSKFSGLLRLLGKEGVSLPVRGEQFVLAAPEADGLRKEVASLQDLANSALPKLAVFRPCSTPSQAVELLHDWAWTAERLLQGLKRLPDLTDQLARLIEILEAHNDETARFLDVHLHLTGARRSEEDDGSGAEPAAVPAVLARARACAELWSWTVPSGALDLAAWVRGLVMTLLA